MVSLYNVTLEMSQYVGWDNQSTYCKFLSQIIYLLKITPTLFNNDILLLIYKQ